MSFSKIFVNDPEEGLHLFSLIVKPFVYCVIRFTIKFDIPDGSNQIQNFFNVSTTSKTVRPFESNITVARWLNHSLGIITASRNYEVSSYFLFELCFFFADD